MSEFSREDFLKRVVKPEFGDSMNFQITKQVRDDNMGISMEAIDGLLDQMKTFILGRMLSAWGGGKGDPPLDLLATLKLSWEAHPEEVLEIGLPWWNLVDGSHRGGA